MDGQQRITSLGRFITDKFAIKDENGMEQYFGGMAKDKQTKDVEAKEISNCSHCVVGHNANKRKIKKSVNWRA